MFSSSSSSSYSLVGSAGRLMGLWCWRDSSQLFVASDFSNTSAGVALVRNTGTLGLAGWGCGKDSFESVPSSGSALMLSFDPLVAGGGCGESVGIVAWSPPLCAALPDGGNATNGDGAAECGELAADTVLVAGSVFPVPAAEDEELDEDGVVVVVMVAPAELIDGGAAEGVPLEEVVTGMLVGSCLSGMALESGCCMRRSISCCSMASWRPARRWKDMRRLSPFSRPLLPGRASLD